MTSTDPSLKIHEIYLSVQGESTHVGKPCVFVRLTGCPLRCSWCDTEHAFYSGEHMNVSTIITQVLNFDVPLVEITGGEPLIQKNVHLLMTKLCDHKKEVLIETSGAFDIGMIDPRVRVIMDIKCPDSNESKKNLYSNLGQLKPKDEVKFVLSSRKDYDFAKSVIYDYDLEGRCELLMSPVFGQIDPKSIVEWILEDKLGVRFQLQLHKFIWPPDKQGV